jgi:Sulfotransferase domain
MGGTMTLQVVGAGVGRTGTLSLKVALERLLGGRCYHMDEVRVNPHHVPLWERALSGHPVDWEEIYSGYAATVDWPGAAFWPELTSRYPDALVILSQRDAVKWWNSARDTFVELMLHEQYSDPLARERSEMAYRLITSRFCPDLADAKMMLAAYEEHMRAVRDAIDSTRLIIWEPGEGWTAIADALGLPEPAEKFPHLNTRDYFRDRFGLPPRR